jgi:hypothetical protein
MARRPGLADADSVVSSFSRPRLMLQHRRHAPTLTILAELVRVPGLHAHHDEVIRVGRLPRTDTFRIGVEVFPRAPEERRGRTRRPDPSPR